MFWNTKWFPGTNLQDLNLDWILKKIAALRGGQAGQVLSKVSNKDFDFEWTTGGSGSSGATFIPSVSSAGVISWTNDGGLPNPEPVNIKGPRGNTGATGPAGPGLPSGGEIGQVPVKKSATDFDIEWRYPLDGIQNVTVAGENLDNYTTGGYWYFGVSYPPINKPADTSSNGFLFILKGSNYARMVQVWIDSPNNAIYTRANTTTTVSWGEWRKIATDADIALLAKKSDFATESITPVVLETLPEGVSDVHAFCIRSGNVVNVNLWLVRDSTTITSFQNIISGFPVPKIRPTVGTVGIPLAALHVMGLEQTGSPLSISINASGNLRVRNGDTAGTYAGSFTYITDNYVT